MKSLKVKEKGMTLIALVVTIIVLMILATISISIFFADNGLFSRAFQSKKWHEIEQIREKLEIEKEPVFIRILKTYIRIRINKRRRHRKHRK